MSRKQFSELTDEEFLRLFQIAQGTYPDNYYIKDLKRWSSCEIMVTQGYSKLLFGIIKCDSDVRLGDGFSFFMKKYLSEDGLVVSGNGIEEKRQDYTKESFELVKNQNLLFAELLDMGF